ncbi:hypothetical protein PGT21_012011 [Puccinia graminis f. sp. tritici]|uniref:Uncharacterized protein n=1 Tax=Puccinia graminis f. sp. tritici TaxID=56615 RepID=A0A5B0PRK6_PUCGR|nr:hypothetical protein PGT21_012011 [Puccinia graminis f. sp. tritici]
MSLSPAEVNAATALADMLTNNSPLSSSYSTDRHVSVGLDDGFTLPPLVEIRPSAYLQAHAGAILDVDTSTNADLGFVPLFNAAPATPVSLSSDQDGSIATEDKLGPSDSEEDSRLPTLADTYDCRRETYLQSNATLIASPTPSEQFFLDRAIPESIEPAMELPSREEMDGAAHSTKNLASPEPDSVDYSAVIPASNGYCSPSAVSFSDLPGNGTADSPYYVNTPPPGPEDKITAAERGPFFC